MSTTSSNPLAQPVGVGGSSRPGTGQQESEDTLLELNHTNEFSLRPETYNRKLESGPISEDDPTSPAQDVRNPMASANSSAARHYAGAPQPPQPSSGGGSRPSSAAGNAVFNPLNSPSLPNPPGTKAEAAAGNNSSATPAAPAAVRDSMEDDLGESDLLEMESSDDGDERRSCPLGGSQPVGGSQNPLQVSSSKGRMAANSLTPNPLEERGGAQVSPGDSDSYGHDAPSVADTRLTHDEEKSREPAFSAMEVQNRKGTNSFISRAIDIIFKWKVFFLVVLGATCLISAVGCILAIVELSRNLTERNTNEITVYAAITMMETISACSVAIYSPGEVVSPMDVSKLRKAINRASWSKKEMKGHLSDAASYLAASDCNSAVLSYNNIFVLGYQHAETLKNGKQAFTAFARGWALAWTQLFAEGLLTFTEDTPISSFRAIRGVASNVMCLSTLNAAPLSPLMAAEYQCDSIYSTILSDSPVLQSTYRMDLRSTVDLINELDMSETIPSPLGSDIFHVSLWPCIFLIALLFIFLTLTAAFQNQAVEEEHTIVSLDFRTSLTHVEMRRSTLRLLDYYTWKMAALEGINAYQARHMGFEVSREKLIEELKDKLHAAKQVGGDGDEGTDSIGSGAANVPLLKEKEKGKADGKRNKQPENDAEASNGQLARQETLDAATQMINQALGPHEKDLTRIGGEEDIHAFYGQTVLKQLAEREARLTQYITEATSLEDAAQIQLLLHKAAYSLQLLKPLVPQHLFRSFSIDPSTTKNLGPSIGLRERELVLQQGLKTDVSTYLFVSFFAFNRPEAVEAAKFFYLTKREMKRNAFMESEAELQSKRCCGEKDLEKLYEEHEEPLITTIAEREGAYTEKDQYIYLENEEDEESKPMRGKTHHMTDARGRLVLVDADGKTKEDVPLLMGGRLANCEEVIERVLRQREQANNTVEGGVVLDVGSDITSNPMIGAPHSENGPETIPQLSAACNMNVLSPTASDMNGYGAGMKQKFVSEYPLSNLAAGVNYVMESVFHSANIFHGDVVQVCGDGVLVKFSRENSTMASELGAKHTREESITSTDREEEDNFSDIRVHGKDYHLTCSERAVRAAMCLQEAFRNYLDCSEDMYISPELLQCPMCVLTEDFSFKGRLRYHVSQHYAVLSQCMPLIFALERISTEYGAEIVMTETVKAQVEGIVLARPIHYLQISDLNYHYIKATKGTSHRDLRRQEARSAASEGEEDDVSPAESPTNNKQRGNTTTQLGDDGASPPMSPTAEERKSGNHSHTSKDNGSRFSHTGTVFELFNVMPLVTNDIHHRAYTDDESHNRVRREHWRLIWDKYLSIVAVEPQINLLRKFARNSNAPGHGGDGHGHGQGGLERGGVAGASSSGGADLAATTHHSSLSTEGRDPLGVQDDSLAGSTTSAHNFHRPSLEASLGSSPAAHIEAKGQSISSSILALRDRLHDFMKELHTYNHIYEFSSREQYSCEKLWKYGHDILISLGVTEEELDYEYG